MDYYALKWKKCSIFGEIGEKTSFVDEAQAFRPRSGPVQQEKWSQRAWKTEIAALAA